MQLAWSEDGGRSFGPARRVDSGGALGRVDACTGPDGRVLVSWLRRGDAAGAWMARGCAPGGEASAAFAIADASAERSSGILRLAADEDGWLAAWTGDRGRGIRVARVRAP